MDIPRQLIYQERTDIKEFDINKKGTLNNELYEKWILKRPDLYPEKSGIASRKLNVFNDAYYMCTLLLMWKDNCENALPYLVRKTSLPSVVIPMVYFYLSHLQEKTTDTKRLMESIEAAAQNDEKWKTNLDAIKNVKCDTKVNNATFKLRSISEKSLSKIHYTTWGKATNHFSESTIKIIIKKVAKNSNVQLLIAEAIRLAAIKEEEMAHVDQNDTDYADPNDSSNWEEVDLGEIPSAIDITYGIVSEIRENNGLIELFSQTESEPLDERVQALKTQATGDLKERIEVLFTDDLVTNPAFSSAWLYQMIDNLMDTRWGTHIAGRWAQEDTHDTITCTLVRVLLDKDVLKKIKSGKGNLIAIARKMTEDSSLHKNFRDYMSKKKYDKVNKFTLSDWLVDYIERSLSDTFPTVSDEV